MTPTEPLFELDDLQQIVDTGGTPTPAQHARADELITLFNKSPKVKAALQRAVEYHKNPRAVADDIAAGRRPAWIDEANIALAQSINHASRKPN